MHCKLYHILKKPEAESINYLFPSQFLWLNKTKDTSLIAVQVTSFECGGITVSLCISHKIVDAFSIATFLNDWAKVSRGERIFPEFMAMSTKPTKESIGVQELEIEKSKCVTKRFVFSSANLDQLKAIAVNPGLRNPTRVEAVTALLYKTAMSAARSQYGLSKDSYLIQLVNMRSRMIDLPFPKNSLGNFVWYFTIFVGKHSDKKVTELTSQLQEGFSQLCCSEGENVRYDEWIAKVSQNHKTLKALFDDTNTFRCVSYCRFPFYEVDYGWGNPLWVTMPSNVVKNGFHLIDTRDGNGIEALVTLEEKNMAIFEHDEDLLTFATLNPSVV